MSEKMIGAAFRLLAHCLLVLPLAVQAGQLPPPPPPPPSPPTQQADLPMLSNGAASDDQIFLTEICEPKTTAQPIHYPTDGHGVSGTVRLRVIVNPCGQIRRAFVLTSSGSGALDQSAVAQAMGWVIALPHGTPPGHGLMANLPVHFEYTGTAESEALANYDMKLGQMHGLIASAQMREDICADAFPQWATANHAAHMAWRQQYLGTIDRVENRFQARLSNIAGGDPVQLGIVMRRFADGDAQYQIGLRKQMMVDGQQNFARQCQDLPSLLASDLMNLDKSFSEQMKVIQAGMPATSADAGSPRK